MSDTLNLEKEISPEVQEAVDESIKQRAIPQTGGGVYLMNWLARANEQIAPWWSRTRDVQLSDFWKKVDHLSGAIYTMTSKMVSIPIKVVPKDPTNKLHMRDADLYTDLLMQGAEFGSGWMNWDSKWVEDMLSQDNGAFGLIIADGNPGTPITGRPYTITHLDSSRVWRTGNPIFPITYQDTDGKIYTYHYSRVLMTSQMPSPRADMYGVGFCAVSRCINTAQNLFDIMVYKQEKLGSRPLRQLIITQGGLDPADLEYAFKMSGDTFDDMGLTRYSKMVIGGSATLPQADLKTHDLASLPDGFDEQTSVILGMAVIALAFGTDARELFPAMGVGATRADALLQHLKQRGKGPGQIIQTTEHQINTKFLPAHLKLTHDYQDDAEDRQTAEIKNIRATRRRQLIMSGEIDLRTSRQIAMTEGDLTDLEFQQLELQDGRLEDGTSVLILFYDKSDADVSRLLSLGVEDPLDVELNDPEMMVRIIREKELEAARYLAAQQTLEKRISGRKAMAALAHLEKVYRYGEYPFAIEKVDLAPSEEDDASEDEGDGSEEGQDEGRNRKLDNQRRVDLTTPRPDEMSSSLANRRGEKFTRQPSEDEFAL